MRGPVVQVTVSVEQNIAQQLLQSGTTLPPPITGFALIDTGASMTCIDDEAAQTLRLPVIDVAKMASASHDSTDCNIYPIQIDIPGINLKIGVPRAMGAALRAQDLLLLIGRDVLQHGTLFYNSRDSAERFTPLLETPGVRVIRQGRWFPCRAWIQTVSGPCNAAKSSSRQPIPASSQGAPAPCDGWIHARCCPCTRNEFGDSGLNPTEGGPSLHS